jgi:hypothetical protein
VNPYAQKELEPPATPLKRGDTGPKVKRVQEWLCLHGHHTAVDGVFGPATDAAVRAFQRHTVEEDVVGREEWITNAADERTWWFLTEPMRRAVEWRPHGARGNLNVVDCAHGHLHANPHEVGGPNMGPWVRLYMDGREGPEYPWCAGFATYVLSQAFGHDKWRTFSCDDLAARAQESALFLPGFGIVAETDAKRPRPGDLFIIRRDRRQGTGQTMPRSDWHHTGIVTAVGDGYFETIEGNTNTNGAREGTAVHARTRSFGPNVDFVMTGGDS